MTEANLTESIVRRRMHGLYLTRRCADIVSLSRELNGLHSWFYRNVPFSALIRGADISGWKTALTKTWLYRGTLHGAVYEELPRLLALSEGSTYLDTYFGKPMVEKIADEVLRYMDDGVFSRAEFRRIFADDYDSRVVDAMFSPWGGVFVHLARQGKVAFRDMTSRDFDRVDAEPTRTREEVLPELVREYFAVYGPATLADAAGFLGIWKEPVKQLRALPLDELDCVELKGERYYCVGEPEIADIPELTLLSGFDPMIVAYTDRRAVLPPEHKARVILRSGICNPTIMLNGRVAGIWNIKKGQPVVEFFEPPERRLESEARERVDYIIWRMAQA